MDSFDCIDPKQYIWCRDVDAESRNKLEIIESIFINNKHMINPSKGYRLLSASKIIFSKLFLKEDFLVKTIFTKDIENLEEDVKKLDFPIIGKPAEGHSGIGMKIFNDIKELKKEKKYKEKFDLFCNFLDVDKEFRVYMWKDKIIEIEQRVGNKDFKNKDENDETVFDYIPLNMELFFKRYSKKSLKDIVKKIREKIDLDIWVVDLMTEKGSNKIYVPEINTRPGLTVYSLISYMEAIQKTWKCFVDSKDEEEFTKYLEDKYLKKELTKILKNSKKYEKDILK